MSAYTKVDAGIVQLLRDVTAPKRVVWCEEKSSDAVMDAHSHDWSFHPTARPELVVFPETAEEVAEILKLCNQRKVPVTTRGAGTGVEGAAIPYSGGLVLNTDNFQKVDVISENMIAVVGVGVKKLQLNKALKKYGLLFGPDPSSNPCLGGMVSTSGSGMSTQKYGTTRENVVSLVVVTPEGEIIKTRRDVRKSSTGYDLTQLYIGSEGTLGVICEVVVKVKPIPRQRSGAIMRFNSVKQAANAVIGILRANLSSLARCELLNADGIKATNEMFQTSLKVVPTLMLEFQGEDPSHLEGDYAIAKETAENHQVIKSDYCETGGDLDDMWEARRGCYPAAIKYRQQNDKVLLTDVCVPVSHLARCIAQSEADFHAHNMPCIICAHIADGNFHCLIPYQPDELELVHKLEERIIQRALAFGGTVSGEHGVGVGKMKHIIEEHGKEYINLMRRIKKALDPNSIMNPNKIFALEEPLAKL
mmetsp:Transcript_16399/g.27567  ORF Transcript_16399/g.27567 Transcript_16399/m.27567 type:complete len:475 (-) Transcript_16399:547-1971(-)|eukprot:CAMPEP_0198203668 /NCGR_PEP_ID=MMETSP1445-20131203/6990_1 /TAXON_ID=36898 /ORGANISM="Pyramimonas sp., Strain CCMP2087" /LENGTH=474 /DNA_ID=CAMNT_0043875151 /DNA_START=436 /DNA_END=1860 /DNA_ORIENTATION=-